MVGWGRITNCLLVHNKMKHPLFFQKNEDEEQTNNLRKNIMLFYDITFFCIPGEKTQDTCTEFHVSKCALMAPNALPQLKKKKKVKNNTKYS